MKMDEARAIYIRHILKKNDIKRIIYKISLWDSDSTLKQNASRLKMSYRMASAFCSYYGLSHIKRKKRVDLSDKLWEILRMRKLGITMGTISKIYGVSTTTIINTYERSKRRCKNA